MKLMELRLQRGLTQKDLAKISGLSNHTIMNIEKSYYRPTTETISAVAKALEINPWDVDEFRAAVTNTTYQKPKWRE
jgi:transcriptional regulator with XRE-family HTH domain